MQQPVYRLRQCKQADFVQWLQELWSIGAFSFIALFDQLNFKGLLWL